MFLPNSCSAIIDIDKIRDYCLNPDHPRGKHKARVFESALGLKQADAETLRRLILDGVANAECVRGVSDQYGERYFVDCEISHGEHSWTVRTAWIVLSAEEFPRLTTCYVC